MKKTYKILLTFILLFTFSFGVQGTQNTAYAEDDKTAKDETPKDDLFTSDYGKYKNKNYDYELDILTDDDIEKTSTLSAFLNPFDTLKGEGNEYFNMMIFKITNMAFKLDLTFTNMLIKALDFGYSAEDVLNPLIDKVSESVAKMSGLASGGFSTKGLYGLFVSLICGVVAIYTVYQYMVKRQFIGAMSNIVKTIIAFTLALALFSNLSTVLKGINSLSTTVSVSLLPSTVSKGETAEIKSVRNAMYDNVFNSFVHKPYLMLQYSTTDESELGDSRIKALLAQDAGTEGRLEVAKKEVTKYNNYTLSTKYTDNRLMFACLMLVVNAINSIPLFLLSLVMILCHFWFIIMAIIAPFALLWGALPNQFGVIKKYSFELCLPIVLKIGLVLISIILFGLTDIVYNLQDLQSGLGGFLLTGMIQMIMFVSLFVLRKRIMNIFTLGSQEIAKMREAFSEGKDTALKPVKSAVKGTATAVGAGIGAMTGNPVAGMSIGSSVGQGLTGDKKLSDTVQGVARTALLSNSKNGNSNTDKLGNPVSKDFYKRVTDKNMSDNEKDIKATLVENGDTEEKANEKIMQMRQVGLNDTTANEYKKALNEDENESNNGALLTNLQDQQKKKSNGYYQSVTDENLTSNESQIKDYLVSNGHTEKSADKLLLNMRKEGLSDMPLEEAKKANNNVLSNAIDDDFKKTPQEYVLQTLRNQDKDEKYNTLLNAQAQGIGSGSQTVQDTAATTDVVITGNQTIEKSIDNVIDQSTMNARTTGNESINKTLDNVLDQSTVVAKATGSESINKTLDSVVDQSTVVAKATGSESINKTLDNVVDQSTVVSRTTGNANNIQGNLNNK
ncbi:CD3337/EF1877 family mobilome membrane protein [Viridibacillus arvi]|uniref:CD3337/EF1877 family mobilome membrane protein n=1 Tax=Viridibacillus arvi TaxID=263475 RepID=UPI003D0380F7